VNEPYDPYGLPPDDRPARQGAGRPPGDPAPWAGQHPPVQPDLSPQVGAYQATGPYPAQWPPRVPPPPEPLHLEPQPYHRLLVTRTYRWWRSLLGLAIFGAAFAVLTIAVTVAVIAADVVRTGGPVDESIDRFGSESDLLFLLGTNLGLAMFIPAAVLAVVVAHRMRPGWLSSVAGRMRWSLLARMCALALAMVVLFTIIGGFLIPIDDGALDLEDIQLVSLSTWLSLAVVIVATTPLQAAAEEFAFRGYTLQALGAWFRSPWIAAVVTSLAFAFAHGAQNLPLFLDRFAFGLIACWLVIRTGGLEAAIAMHVMNNAVVFLVSAAYDDVGSTLEVSEIPWAAVIIDVLQMAAFAFLADRHVRKRGLATRSTA
jgi:uncharacterized protein